MYFIVNNKFCVRQLTADGDIFLRTTILYHQKEMCLLSFYIKGKKLLGNGLFVCMANFLSVDQINQSTNID